MRGCDLPRISKTPDWAVRVPIGIALVGVVLACTGYVMPSGNHATQIPPILVLLDPELYAYDFHVQQMSRFTVRTYFIYMIYGLASTGMGLAWAFFTTYLVALAGYLAAAYGLGRAIAGSKYAAALFMILAVLPIRMAVGMTYAFIPTPVPQVYAMPFALFGLYQCLKRQWVSGYALFGLASLLQFLVGTLPAAALALLMLFDVVRRRRLKEGALALLAFGALVAAVYVPMTLGGTTSTDLLSNQQFVEMYAKIRAPHHLLVSSWPRHEMARFGSFVAGGVLCVLLSRAMAAWTKAVILTVIGASVAAILGGYLFIEIWPVAFVAKLQVARLTPFCQLLILATIATEAARCWSDRKYPLAIAMMLTVLIEYGGIGLGFLVVLGWVARVWGDRLKQDALRRFWRMVLWPGVLIVTVAIAYRSQPPHLDRAHVLAVFVLVLVVATLPALFERYVCSRNLRVALAWATAVVAVTTAAVWTMGTGGGGPQDGQDHPVLRPVRLWDNGANDIDLLAGWMRRDTPKDVLVLVPPSAQMFKLRSQRSVVVDFKSFPLVDAGMIEWRQRMEAVLGTPLEPGMVNMPQLDELYSQRSGSDLKDVAVSYGAQYIVTRWHDHIQGCSVAYRQGPWVAFEING